MPELISSPELLSRNRQAYYQEQVLQDPYYDYHIPSPIKNTPIRIPPPYPYYDDTYARNAKRHIHSPVGSNSTSSSPMRPPTKPATRTRMNILNIMNNQVIDHPDDPDEASMPSSTDNQLAQVIRFYEYHGNGGKDSHHHLNSLDRSDKVQGLHHRYDDQDYDHEYHHSDFTLLHHNNLPGNCSSLPTRSSSCSGNLRDEYGLPSLVSSNAVSRGGGMLLEPGRIDGSTSSSSSSNNNDHGNEPVGRSAIHVQDSGCEPGSVVVVLGNGNEANQRGGQEEGGGRVGTTDGTVTRGSTIAREIANETYDWGNHSLNVSLLGGHIY